MTIELSSAGGHLAEIRRLVESWAQDVGAEPTALQLIATELVTNAINVSPPDTAVLVTLDHPPGRVEVTVADRGPGPSGGRVSFEAPSPGSYRGRGLPIVSALSDELTVERVDEVTVVTATKFTVV